MSKTCGDTARFHRLRKQKIAKRTKIRELRATVEAKNAAKKAASAQQPVA